MRSALVDKSAVNSMYFVSTKAMIITSGFKYDELALHKNKKIIESYQKMALLCFCFVHVLMMDKEIQ